MPVIEVRVKPGARASRLVLQADGHYLAEVKAQPVDGQANAELIRLVAAHFGCTRSQVRVKLGGASRRKWVEVDAAPDPRLRSG